jgi:predicted permease
MWLRELTTFAAIAASERRVAARMHRRERAIDATWKAGAMDGMFLEVQHALRRLLRSPIFSLAAVWTLALAMAANVAIFTVVDRVVLHPLPYPASDRVIKLLYRVPRMSTPFDVMPIGVYFNNAERSRTLEAVAAYQPRETTITGNGEPERIRMAYVTPSLLSVLKVAPARGRWFSDRDGTPGAARTAVLSHGFWMRRFGGDPAIVGGSALFDGVPTEIIGVMPGSFAFPDIRTDSWMAEQATPTAGFGLFTHLSVARLRDGVTLDQARAEITSLIADLPHAFPDSTLAQSLAKDNVFSLAIPLKEATIGNVARPLWILLSAVGVVLLIACANVANLFLVRSEARQREVALRRALGAGGRGIVRFFLTESVLLALAAGALGLLLAWGAVRALVQLGPATLPRLHEVQLSPPSLAFAVVLIAVAALTFGAIPLLHGRPLSATLAERGRGNTASRQRHRARHLLLAGQVALALVLLVASGLMIRSFQKLRLLDPGFNPASALTFRVGLPRRAYGDRGAVVRAHHSLLERLRSLPGVTAVSASTCLPLTGRCFGNSLLVERQAGDDRPPLRPVATFRAVGDAYFETLGIRLLRGRLLTRDDLDRQQPNVVIDQTLANAFGEQDPIGQRVASSRPPTLPAPAWLTIVGVVANTPSTALIETPAPVVFMPMSIAAGPESPITDLVGPSISEMSYVVRSSTDPLGLVSSVRGVVDALDPNLAVAEIRTLQGLVDQSSEQMAFTMVLLAIAASVALMLGLIGIYGVMAYVVSQRTAEIGVRLALGARPGEVAGAIVRQGTFVTVAGLAAGLAVALAGSRVMTSMLYDISPRDTGVFVATPLALLVVALIACWLPARRAARLSPLDALRSE